MTLTRELRLGVACALAILTALAVFVWGNQRQAQASDVPVSGSEILCWINLQDGIHPPVPVFDVGTCEGDNGTTTPPANLPQCADGIDNDHDGKTDWGVPGDVNADPGCSTPTDNDESDDPAPAPQCSNGIDDDHDGKIDYPADPGCSSADDNDEADTGGGAGGTGADLSVEKTVDNASPAPSSTVTYTITVASNGPETASDISVTDLLPSGLAYVSDSGNGAYATTTGIWTVGSLASGSSTSLTIAATVMASAGTAIDNTASITHSDKSDSDTNNNTSSVTITSTEQGSGGGSSSGGGGGSHHRSSGGGTHQEGEVLGAETECPMYLTGYIRYGADNDMGEVSKLQVFLNDFEGGALTVNGVYDAATLAAVNAFQNKYAADVLAPWGARGATGYVYYTTQKEVNTIYCQYQKDFPLSASQEDEIAEVRAIQPQLRAHGATATAGAGAAAASVQASAPSIGSVVPANTRIDENSGVVDATSASAAAANASSTQGWFSKFVHWLFGR